MVLNNWEEESVRNDHLLSKELPGDENILELISGGGYTTWRRHQMSHILNFMDILQQ